MPVGAVLVPVRVLVDEVDLEQQLALREHVVGRAVGAHDVLLGQHDHPVGRLGGDREVVGGDDDGLARRLPLLEHVEQPYLAARVERVGGLVEQQDLRAPS